MSVAHLTTQELATFTAIAAGKCRAGSIGELAEIAALMSRSNAAAYYAQYGEHAAHATADDIEREALRMLAHGDLDGHFGPLLYNCVTNGGTFYYGDLPADATQTDIAIDVARWRKIEHDAQAWQNSRARELKRAEENAVAFNDIGRLPLKSAAELKAAMGDGALIVATFKVNESEIQSDYWGGRQARSVVIGIRKGKRESFPALRKAAAAFPPTADYGPGKDVYTVRVVLAENVKSHGTHYHRGEYSHWHQELGHGQKFTTEAAAAAFIAAAGPPFELGGFDDGPALFEWRIDRESVEHRENYSMGGGNYLGTDRYGGWVVKSQTWIGGAMEVWKL